MRAYPVTPDGAGYKASIVNILDGAKKNNWFRPADVCVAPDGSIYETDSLQALIWKVPPGGGKGQVWLTDTRLQSLIGPPAFGPSAMKLGPDHRTLWFTTVEGPAGDGDPSAGRIWRVSIHDDGTPGPLNQFYVAQSADAPGGMGFARSGDVYVTLTGSNANSVGVLVASCALTCAASCAAACSLSATRRRIICLPSR